MAANGFWQALYRAFVTMRRKTEMVLPSPHIPLAHQAEPSGGNRRAIFMIASASSTDRLQGREQKLSLGWPLPLDHLMAFKHQMHIDHRLVGRALDQFEGKAVLVVWTPVVVNEGRLDIGSPGWSVA